VEQRQEPRKEAKKSRFEIEALEERIAPTANHNPGLNNTNLPGNQPPDGNSGNNPR
jgi:hypothetical protein